MANSSYLTPGVYYERVDASAPGISVLRTDVAGFVGIAERGPIDMPVPIESWRQFQAHFGGFTGGGFLAYTVRGFFENGGRRCWVVRVASLDESGGARDAGTVLLSPTGAEVWRVAASSPGSWGNNLSVTVRRTRRAQTVTVPAKSRPVESAVTSTSGFKRWTMVRLSQGTAAEEWKIVSDIDPIDNYLIWVNRDPGARLPLPYDVPVQGPFDPDQPLLIESVEYTLVLRESNRPIALFQNLSLVPESDDYGPRVLAPFEDPVTLQSLGQLPPVPRAIRIEERRDAQLIAIEPLDVAADAIIPLAGGADGLALLSTYEYVGEDTDPLDSDEVRRLKRRGLRTLELVDEVSVVAVPDVHIRPILPPEQSPLPPCAPDSCLPQTFVPSASPTPARAPELPPIFSEEQIYLVQAALVQHCEDLRDRVALLDPPASAALDDRQNIGAVRAWRSRFESKYAAFYYPWLRVVDPLRTPNSLTRDIPPAGHVAGQYARTDFEVGVHKAPANSPLAWVQDVTVAVGDEVQGVLNPLGINVVRPLRGRGIRIYGARTTSSDPDWVFVNVRRLLMMIEKAIFAAMQWAAFEPNDFATRSKLHLALTSFLIALWQRGALMGATTTEAFRVKCDEENNPPAARDVGQLLAEVWVAPSKPFEFVVLRIGRTDNEFEIAEARVSTGGV